MIVLDQVFRSFTYARVLDYLVTQQLDKPGLDYSITEIHKGAGVTTRSLIRVLPDLRKLGLIKVSRKVGWAYMYKLDTESKAVRDLIHFVDEMRLQYVRLDSIKPIVLSKTR